MSGSRRRPALLLATLLVLGGAGCGLEERQGDAAGPREVPATAGRPGGTPQAAGGNGKKPDGRWAIEWQRGRGARGEVVKIGTGVVAIGPVGGRARRYLFVEPARSRELLAFTRTYAPFRLTMGGGVLALRGQGRVRPGPGDRRMIYEWTRQVAAEVGGVEPGSGYGLVLIWQRTSGSGCDEVTVYLSGEVRAGSCGGDNAIAGRLAPGPLAWLYDRFDRLAAFQTAAASASLGLSPRLVFAGHGRQTAGAEDRRDLEGFGAALARELAPRRPSSPSPPSPPSPPLPDSPAGARLLLPPQPALPLPEVIVPDDRLPPPPPVRHAPWAPS